MTYDEVCQNALDAEERAWDEYYKSLSKPQVRMSLVLLHKASRATQKCKSLLEREGK